MKKFLIVLTVVAMAAFLLVGCTPTTNTAPVFTSTPSETATVGIEYSYTPIATDADDDTVTFSVAGPTTMAISAGVITWTPTAVGSEAVIVTATDGTDLVTQSFTITISAAPVVPVAVTSVTLDKTTLALVAGGATGTLVETVLPADATDPSVIWASSAPAVATVALGVVTPVTAGTAYITVTTVDGSKTAICAVTVSAAPVAVTSVTLDQATMTLTAVGTTGILVETVLPATATDKTVAWASSDEAVATVAGGVVTPLTAGTADITVTTVDGSKTATCVVTVVPKLLTSIVVLPETMSLDIGETEDITSVTAHYSDGTTAVITPLTECTFKSSDIDGDVVTVDEATGEVTAVAPGTATITVSYKEEDTTRTVYYVEESDTVVVTVKTPKVHNVTKDVYYNTIEDALTGAAAYDIIEVAAGTYKQVTAAPLDITKNGLTLRGAGYATTIIDFNNTSGGSGIQISAQHVTVEGFTVKGAWNAIQIDNTSDSNSATVTDNKIYGLLWCWGKGDSSEISDNIIVDGGINLDGGAAEGGLNFLTIKGNDISNGNINMNGGTATYANMLITENTITGSGTGYAGIDIRGTVTNSTITYNNLNDNPGGGIIIYDNFDAASVIHYNNIEGNGSFGLKVAATATGSNVIDAILNWWGAASGPSGGVTDDNAVPAVTANGTGDAIVNDSSSGPLTIDFYPFSEVEN